MITFANRRRASAASLVIAAAVAGVSWPAQAPAVAEPGPSSPAASSSDDDRSAQRRSAPRPSQKQAARSRAPSRQAAPPSRSSQAPSRPSSRAPSRPSAAPPSRPPSRPSAAPSSRAPSRPSAAPPSRSSQAPPSRRTYVRPQTPSRSTGAAPWRPGTSAQRDSAARRALPPSLFRRPGTPPATGAPGDSPPRWSIAPGNRRAPATRISPELRERIESIRARLADHPLARPRVDGIDRARQGLVRGPEPDTGSGRPPGRPAPGGGAPGLDAGEQPSIDGAGPARGISAPAVEPIHESPRHRFIDHKRSLFVSSSVNLCFGTGYRLWSGFRYCAPATYDWCWWNIRRCWVPLYDRWCSYWWGYWPYRPSYSWTRTVYSTTYLPVYPPPCAYTQSQAWDLLAEGRVDVALDAFDCLRNSIPEDGLAEVGFALASAALGDDDSALRSLRSAMVRDPGALALVPVDDRLHRILGELVGRYEYRARRSYGDFDALFMAGALRYLMGDQAAAQYALEAATTLGDDDESTLNLFALVAGVPAGR